MAPHGEGIGNGGSSCSSTSTSTSTQQRSMISNIVHRTTSDISFQISKEALVMRSSVQLVDDDDDEKLQNNRRKVVVGPDPISEVVLVVAKCECCGMSEECTPEYIERVRSKFMGKWVCGLCAEAVKEEKEKLNNAVVLSMEEALNIHINACSRFNKLGRAYPVLFQAQAMREMLKKTNNSATLTAAKSFNPRDPHHNRPLPIARSSSCIPAITNINPSSSN